MQQFNHTKSEEQKASDWEGNEVRGDKLDCYMISGFTYSKYIKRFKFNKGVHKLFDCSELEKAPQKFISWKKKMKHSYFAGMQSSSLLGCFELMIKGGSVWLSGKVLLQLYFTLF